MMRIDEMIAISLYIIYYYATPLYRYTSGQHLQEAVCLKIPIISKAL